ncbi:Molybdenum cofactor sulfurase [Madurella fahalii]|uniref:Molybdenum cofactor sulfurase n=1 Tax=Madurella fahalii TaxID=1157608 RepID=A0ABQ0FZM5_9PEZI
MARPSILVRLSGRKQEGRPVGSNGSVKPPAHESSWRRRPLASLSRKVNSSPRPVFLSHADDDKNVPRVSFDDCEDTVLPPRYERPVETIRQDEYPHMNHGTYLDHSGTTIYARSTVERFTQKMLSGLYGNPHSANQPAKISGDMVDSIREKTLHFLGADPRHFDLIFTANATAAVKLVADCFRDLAEQTRSGSFWYGYHRDAHTSIVGVRELTNGDHHVFEDDAEVEEWLDGYDGGAGGGGPEQQRVSSLGLFAYPGQSNLTGRRLPLEWARRLRAARHLQNTYSFLDAAALAMTSPMSRVFADPAAAPDFACVSFYKIFGFPDLGGLVVRRDSGHILTLRKYFGGGTVSMVSAVGGAWHISKGLESTRAGGHGGGGGGGGIDVGVGGALHEGLEDGTLPFHSILALGEAIDVHAELYGPMENISKHTTALVQRLYRGMSRLSYGNGQPLCKVYEGDDGAAAYGDATRQGATIAFNVFRADGGYEPYSTVERLANERGVYVRSGGICCPGGLFTALQYEPWQLNRARSAGHHCASGSNGLSLINELPTGVVRASLGAMSTAQDVDNFLSFLRETFLGREDRVRISGSTVSGKIEQELVTEQREHVPQVAACCAV